MEYSSTASAYQNETPPDFAIEYIHKVMAFKCTDFANDTLNVERDGDHVFINIRQGLKTSTVRFSVNDAATIAKAFTSLVRPI